MPVVTQLAINTAKSTGAMDEATKLKARQLGVSAVQALKSAVADTYKAMNAADQEKLQKPKVISGGSTLDNILEGLSKAHKTKLADKTEPVKDLVIDVSDTAIKCSVYTFDLSGCDAQDVYNALSERNNPKSLKFKKTAKGLVNWTNGEEVVKFQAPLGFLNVA